MDIHEYEWISMDVLDNHGYLGYLGYLGYPGVSMDIPKDIRGYQWDIHEYPWP